MIEYRGIVRLAKQTYMASNLNIGTGIAHIADLALYASTWEIYTAILIGATLVRLDYITALDIAKLSSTFMRENIRISKFTLALLDKCTSVSEPRILTEHRNQADEAIQVDRAPSTESAPKCATFKFSGRAVQGHKITYCPN